MGPVGHTTLVFGSRSDALVEVGQKVGSQADGAVFEHAAKVLAFFGAQHALLAAVIIGQVLGCGVEDFVGLGDEGGEDGVGVGDVAEDHVDGLDLGSQQRGREDQGQVGGAHFVGGFVGGHLLEELDEVAQHKLVADGQALQRGAHADEALLGVGDGVGGHPGLVQLEGHQRLFELAEVGLERAGQRVDVLGSQLLQVADHALFVGLLEQQHLGLLAAEPEEAFAVQIAGVGAQEGNDLIDDQRDVFLIGIEAVAFSARAAHARRKQLPSARSGRRFGFGVALLFFGHSWRRLGQFLLGFFFSFLGFLFSFPGLAILGSAFLVLFA